MSTDTGPSRASVPPRVSVLEPFVAAGVFAPAEVHLAATVARLAPASAPEVLLAVAVAARGPRLGHVCAVLDDIAVTVVPHVRDAGEESGPASLPWPDPQRWRELLGAAREVVAAASGADDLPLRPLVLDGSRLYLHRYWSHEVAVAARLRERAAQNPEVDRDALQAALLEHFGAESAQDGGVDLQRRAAEVALTSGVSVIAGGPGTGKTTTVAKLLLAAHDLAGATHGGPLRVALAAPTGKAAARMGEAVATLGRSGGPGGGEGHTYDATTIHRLLGWAPGPGFAHDAEHPLEVDLVVVDETSMVDLSLMAHLLDAVPPEARVVLVGDPHQLASVEAGTVLGDVVAAANVAGSPLEGNLVELTRVHRYAEDSAIAAVAESIRVGDADATVVSLLGRDDRPGEPGALQLTFDDVAQSGPRGNPAGGRETARWVDADDADGIASLRERLASAGAQVVAAARAGETGQALAHVREIKLLAATRGGPFGLYSWTDSIESAVATESSGPVTTLRRGERWYIGKPVLVTANDPILDVSNGDVGVVVGPHPRGNDGTGTDRSVALDGEPVRHLPTARLEHTEPWWAMTIHKSQGSEFPQVVVSLPAASSPILTRELLYTAVTRAREAVTIIGSEEAIRAAVERPVVRASGLVQRLADRPG